MRRMAHAVVEHAIEHIRTLDAQPVCGNTRVEDACRAMREPAPETGVALEPLLEQVFQKFVPHSFNTASPGYLAFIPGGGLFPAALADFIADTVNRYTGVFRASPMLVQLEANALDWIRDWVNFPPSARGLFTTGGSMAAFNAIVCARERHLGHDLRRGTMYVSTQAHHSLPKSARLAGIMPDRVRRIPVDAQFRMRIDALRSAISQDRAAGLHPFLVVSSAGTVNTGAVDPLEAVADLAAREDLWHHIDGAYGGFFYMCDELRPLLSGLPRGDSLTLDPHKGMFLPYGTGALLVRDGAALRAAHGAEAEYLPRSPASCGEDDLYDPSQYGPDLSRGFPGLRVWLSVKLFGSSKFKAALLEKRTLARQAAQRLESVPGIRMVAPPELSLFAFHLTWPNASREQENAATRQLIERVVDRGRIMLTGCTIEDRFLARICVLSFRTRREQIETCIQHITEESAAILANRR